MPVSSFLFSSIKHHLDYAERSTFLYSGVWEVGCYKLFSHFAAWMRIRATSGSIFPREITPFLYNHDLLSERKGASIYTHASVSGFDSRKNRDLPIFYKPKRHD
jgi:hypothetical protein